MHFNCLTFLLSFSFQDDDALPLETSTPKKRPSSLSPSIYSKKPKIDEPVLGELKSLNATNKEILEVLKSLQKSVPK